MESRRRNQLKTRGNGDNMKQKVKQNMLQLKKENRNNFLDAHRNMSPGTPDPVSATQQKPRTQRRLKISEIKNRTEQLETWRLEKNRIKLQEIQDHRSPFQSVVPVGRFLEKKEKEKPIKALIKTPVREKLINSHKPISKYTVTKILQSEKSGTPVVADKRKLFGTASKVPDSTYSRRYANVQSKVDSRPAKKNILGELEAHAKVIPKVVQKRETKVVVKKQPIIVKPVPKPIVRQVEKNKKVVFEKATKKLEIPASDTELLDRTFEINSPESVPFNFKNPLSTSPQPEPVLVLPPVFQFKAKSKTYILFKQSMDARKTMLNFCLTDWENTKQDDLCKNFLNSNDAEVIAQCIMKIRRLLVDLREFGVQLDTFENKTGNLSKQDLQDLWDFMSESKEGIEEGKRIMESIQYSVQEAKNEAAVASLKKKRVKRMTKAYDIDEFGEKTTPRRSTRLRKMTHSDCTGCTPSAHKHNTPKSAKSKNRLKKSVLFVDGDSFNTPRSNNKTRRQTGYRRTPSALRLLEDESDPEEIFLIDT